MRPIGCRGRAFPSAPGISGFQSVEQIGSLCAAASARTPESQAPTPKGATILQNRQPGRVQSPPQGLKPGRGAADTCPKGDNREGKRHGLQTAPRGSLRRARNLLQPGDRYGVRHLPTGSRRRDRSPQPLAHLGRRSLGVVDRGRRGFGRIRIPFRIDSGRRRAGGGRRPSDGC